LPSVLSEKDITSTAEGQRRLLDVESGPVCRALAAVRKDGSTVDVEVRAMLAAFHGRPAIIGMMRDISRK
jgi:PAS domain S-box-containing protein